MKSKLKARASDRPLTLESRRRPLASGRLQLAADRIVSILLAESAQAVRPVQEASVHRARRSRIWIASFTGSVGGQEWRSTGLTDHEQALLLARRWEARAREQRTRLGRVPAEAHLRVGPAERGHGMLSQREVARILRMSERGVREVERRAFTKLRRHPLLREYWRKYRAGELPEAICRRLIPAELRALFDVAITADELHLIERIVKCLGAQPGCEVECWPASAPGGLGSD